MAKTKNRTDAKIVGMQLVASFENGDTPLVWQLDLAHNHSFSLGLSREGDLWALGIARDGKPVENIVAYDNYDDAEKALGTLREALMEDPRSTLEGKKGLFSLSSVAAILLVVVLAYGMMGFRSLTQSIGSAIAPAPKTVSREAPPAPEASAPLKIIPGEPMSADQILKDPKE